METKFHWIEFSGEVTLRQKAIPFSAGHSWNKEKQINDNIHADIDKSYLQLYLRCIRIIPDYIHDPGENFFNPKKSSVKFCC